MKVALVALLLSITCAHATEVGGIPRIVDGDTVQIGATKIRLSGIDAPETDQLCLNAKGDVTGMDKYGRSLATCTIDGVDVDRWMVRSGWALAFVRYSRIYVADELE